MGYLVARLINLNSIPNQQFGVQIEGLFYDFTVQSFQDYSIISISEENKVLISGFLCVPHVRLIPYRYDSKGNFIFISDNDEYPTYKKFGASQFLYFLDENDLKRINP